MKIWSHINANYIQVKLPFVNFIRATCVKHNLISFSDKIMFRPSFDICSPTGLLRIRSPPSI